jgi:hypothetical protein
VAVAATCLSISWLVLLVWQALMGRRLQDLLEVEVVVAPGQLWVLYLGRLLVVLVLVVLVLVVVVLVVVARPDCQVAG